MFSLAFCLRGDFQQLLFIFNYVHVSASMDMYPLAQVPKEVQRGFEFPKLEFQVATLQGTLGVGAGN